MVALARHHEPNSRRLPVPQTGRHYGVIFGLDGQYDLEKELPKLRPQTLATAIVHVLEYEENFVQFGASGHVIDLRTGQEVVFDRNEMLACVAVH